MIEAPQLIDLIKVYNPDVDADLIEQAYVYARDMHGEQMRASGDPYISHPAEVAAIMTEMRLDPASIMTALLHDTIEDTDATYDDIAKLFGDEVASLVDGVTKLTRIESQTIEGKQAENFSKLVLAMSEDIRVLLVKLADRLHNMRTIHHFSDRPDKRKRIARETLEIFVPLAERIGISKLKEELEDLAFSQLYPEARESISNRLAYLRKEGTDLVNKIIDQLGKDISANGVKAEVTGREKSRYSIWRKMQRKNVTFEQLSDIMAFRIIVDNIGDCYQVLGLVHSKYHTVPGRFKDYISTPKPNGYKSIHTTIIGPVNQRIEVQIRTSEMNAEAELGVAAHWAYKSGVKPDQRDARKFRWLRELVDILEQEHRPEEFLEHTKLELFQDQVFCFSPKGDLIELPSGATPVDFAYGIHSDVGDKTVGAKINGRIAPLNTKLNNGDQVEIQTSKTQTPNPTWERFVVTGKARSRIRRYIRLQQRDEYITLGRAMIQKIFRQEGYEYTDKSLGDATKEFKATDPEDLLSKIGSGNVAARDVFRKLFPSHKSKTTVPEIDEKTMQQLRSGKMRASDDRPMPIKGLIPGMAVHFGRCCHPLPGDRIVGIVTTGKGVTVHTIDCDVLETFAETPERWLDVSWGDGPDQIEAHVGRINITMSNEPGALGTLSNVVSSNGGNITNLKIINRSIDFWDMYLDIYVKDIRHLNDILAALRATPIIHSVKRAKGR